MRRIWLGGLTALICGGFLTTATAEVVFAFTGTQTGNITDSTDGTVGDTFPLGSTVAGTFTFDPLLPNSPTGLYPGALSSATFTTSSGYAGTVVNGTMATGGSFFVASSNFGGVVNGPDVGENALTFFDVSVSSSALTSTTTLPSTPPAVTPTDNTGANSDRVTLLFTDDAGATSGIAFELDSLTLVPEPSTLALVSLGGIAILRSRRPL